MKSNQPVRQQAIRILVVTHADGFLELFTDSPIVAHHAAVPATSRAGELAAEEVMERGLPRRFRELFEPGYRRCSINARPLTVQQAITAQVDAIGWKALNRCLSDLQSGQQQQEVAGWKR